MTIVPPAQLTARLREALRAHAAQLGVDVASIAMASPAAITARRADGSLLRLDVSVYAESGVSR